MEPTITALPHSEGEELAQIRSYANSFKDQIKLILQERASINEEQRPDICEYHSEEALPVQAGESFCIGKTIDGEREALPA